MSTFTYQQRYNLINIKYETDVNNQRPDQLGPPWSQLSTNFFPFLTSDMTSQSSEKLSQSCFIHLLSGLLRTRLKTIRYVSWKYFDNVSCTCEFFPHVSESSKNFYNWDWCIIMYETFCQV
jgi:hypothetical protein